MSAPKTNVDRPVPRHRGPLYGMIAMVGFVAILIIGWVFYEAGDATDVPRADGTTAPAGTQAAPSATRPAPTPTYP